MPYRRSLLVLSLPIIGLHVINTAMPAIDAALCGRLPDAEHVLAGIGISVQVVLLLMMAIVGLTIGTVALVGRAHGARSTERVNHLLVQATQLAILLALGVAAAGFLFARTLLLALHATPEAADAGTQYLHVWMLGTPFAYVNLLYAGVLRAVGRPRIPFACALGAMLVNAILSYAFVLGHLGMPALGARGAALGSVCAQGLELVILVHVLRRSDIGGLRLQRLPRPIDHRLAADLFRVGWPAALDLFVVNAGLLGMFGMLAAVGELAVAAHAIVMRVWMLAFVFSLGISLGTAAMVSESLGACNVARTRAIGRASLSLGAALMSALAIAVLAFAPQLVHLFDVAPGTALEHDAVLAMRILGLAIVPASLDIVLVGLLQGAGATQASLRVNAANTFLVQIPTAWFLGFVLHLGALGIWLSFPLSYLTKGLLDYAVYKRERWAIPGAFLGLAVLLLAAGARPAHAQQPPPPTVSLPPVNRNPELTDAAGGPAVFVHVVADASRGEIPGRLSLSTLTALTHLGLMLPTEVLGGYWGAEVLVPVVYVSLERDGRSASATGLGDVTVSPIVLQWRPVRLDGRPFLMQRFSLNVILPTGAYDPNAIVNTSTNVFSLDPYYAFTVFMTKKLETSWRIHYLWNATNEAPPAPFRASFIQPGQAVHANGSLSYEVLSPLRLGIAGSILSQVTDARIDGRTIPSAKEQAFALGPACRVDLPGLFTASLNANWEFAVENRPSGYRVGLSVMHVWPAGDDPPTKN